MLLTGTNGGFAEEPAMSIAAATGPLADYVAANDAEYGWRVHRRGRFGNGRYAELRLTSQRWRGNDWKHQLFVYCPAEVRDPTRMAFYLGGGGWSDELERSMTGPGRGETVHHRHRPRDYEGLPIHALMLAGLGDKLGLPIAALLQVPFQPLFAEQLYEDAAIAYTFQQFLNSGDPTWPLLVPMVKSAVRGMDAVGEFAAKEWSLAPTKFTLAGASKRGWTTWLTAAVDPRVAALAPMVIDMLRLPQHIPLQLASWGSLSEQLRDYTELNIHRQLVSPRGRELLAIVDPVNYVSRISQPKWLLLGTNDRYWPLESLNLYWGDLNGDKHVTYVPNNGHGLSDGPRVLGALAAVHRNAAGDLKLPKFAWQFHENDREVVLTAHGDRVPEAFHAWFATAPTRDFRDAVWSQNLIAPVDGAFRFRMPKPVAGFAALFGEAKFDDPLMPYYLSTNVRVTPATL
jgi:PhoPQ-activated pathogenicity-related protein